MFAAIQAMTAEEGRDPSAVEIVMRANMELTDTLGDDRPSCSGTPGQVVGDLKRCRAIGAHKVIVEPQLNSMARAIDAYTAFMERVVEAAGRRAGCRGPADAVDGGGEGLRLRGVEPRHDVARPLRRPRPADRRRRLFEPCVHG